MVRRLGILAVVKNQFPVKTNLWVRARILISEEKHYKTTLISLQKKENAGFSLNSLTISYDNSIVDGLVIGSVQQEFHCSCYARNETLAVIASGS